MCGRHQCLVDSSAKGVERVEGVLLSLELGELFFHSGLIRLHWGWHWHRPPSYNPGEAGLVHATAAVTHRRVSHASLRKSDLLPFKLCSCCSCHVRHAHWALLLVIWLLLACRLLQPSQPRRWHLSPERGQLGMDDARRLKLRRQATKRLQLRLETLALGRRFALVARQVLLERVLVR